MSDQDRISPYNIRRVKEYNIIESKRKWSIGVLLVGSLTNSVNQHYKTSLADSRENYSWDPRINRVKATKICAIIQVLMSISLLLTGIHTVLFHLTLVFLFSVRTRIILSITIGTDVLWVPVIICYNMASKYV